MTIAILGADGSTFNPASCAVVARMAKDFGDHVLPFWDGDYLPTGTFAPTQESIWAFIIYEMERLLSTCVWHQRRPGWGKEGSNIIILFLPMDSDMRKKWWPDSVMFDSTNSSSF